MNKVLKIGSRGSPLALKQVEMVRAALAKAYPALGTEVVVIKTSGDWSPSDGESRLNEAEGGKGLFAKEIEAALLDGSVDIAVHSMKDMDSNIPKGLAIEHMLPREDASDVLLVREDLRGSIKTLEDLPEGARIGTASVRREAFLKAKRPDVRTEPLRGNVQTRIDKVRGGQVDATFLALAGLKRLELEHEADVILSVEEMLPAAGQGAVGIEMRAGELEIAQMLDAISCGQTVQSVKAERAALKILDGSCRSPIGAYASFDGGQMHLRLKVSSLNGRQSFEVDDTRPVDSVQDAVDFGQLLAHKMLPDIPDGILS